MTRIRYGDFLKTENVVVLLYPGCISFEVALAAELLSKKFRILNVTPDGQDLVEASGLPLKAQMKYADVDLSNCCAVLVPGGNPDSVISDREIARILTVANTRGLTIAGICAGPALLAKSGIVNGRKIAHGYPAEMLKIIQDTFKEVKFVDDLFVVDKNVITAKPEAHIDFAVEIGCRLGVVDASRSGRVKAYYRGTLGRKIRPIALALLKNNKGQLLLDKGYDSIKKEVFYRPLGGGIEFNELGKVAVEREIEEELGLKVIVNELVETFENVFLFEGKAGHEIVMIYQCKFTDIKNYERLEIDIVERGKVVGKAVWRTVDEIRAEGAKLYPNGIEKVLS